ncbi:MAG: fibronectin type III domain-containing protein [Promethearchaeia archaeon]
MRTVAGIPVRVKDLRVVNASSSSIRFAWSPLMGSDKGGGGDMQVEYIVEVVSTEREGSGFAMSFPDMDPFRVENAALELRALPANMLFQVRVSAANSAALVGPASAIVSGRTLPTLAQAVAAPDFEYSEGKLTLSWQSLADQQAAGGMPIDSFRIYQRRRDETAFSAILEVPGNGVFNSMIKANISSTSAGYSYEYRVSVVTGAGEGPLSPASPPVVSPLLPPMPSPTVVLTYPADGLSATAFVSWPPAAAGFAARGFVVSLQDRFVGPDTPFDPGIQVLHRNLTFANLTLGKLYAVRVQALSSQPGIRSEVSDAVVFETRDISVPTSVRLSVYADTTLYVQVVFVWVSPFFWALSLYAGLFLHVQVSFCLPTAVRYEPVPEPHAPVSHEEHSLAGCLQWVAPLNYEQVSVHVNVHF